MGYSKKEKEKRMAFLLPVALELSWELGLLMGVGAAAVAAGSVLHNINGGFPNINTGGFHIPLIHRNQPTTPPVTHQPTAPQVPVQHTLPPVTVPQTTTQPVPVQHKMVFFSF